MQFFSTAVSQLGTIVIGLGAGLGVWGVINPVSYTHLDVYKRQELTTTYGLGFVFGLYNADDIHYADGMLPADTLIAVGMTDMHGKLTFSGNLPHGAYTIRELDGPKGWKLNPNRFDVRISPEKQADDAHVILSLIHILCIRDSIPTRCSPRSICAMMISSRKKPILKPRMISCTSWIL